MDTLSLSYGSSNNQNMKIRMTDTDIWKRVLKMLSSYFAYIIAYILSPNTIMCHEMLCTFPFAVLFYIRY